MRSIHYVKIVLILIRFKMSVELSINLLGRSSIALWRRKRLKAAEPKGIFDAVSHCVSPICIDSLILTNGSERGRSPAEQQKSHSRREHSHFRIVIEKSVSMKDEYG